MFGRILTVGWAIFFVGLALAMVIPSTRASDRGHRWFGTALY